MTTPMKYVGADDCVDDGVDDGGDDSDDEDTDVDDGVDGDDYVHDSNELINYLVINYASD